MLKYLTSGESHGACLVAILEGMPAGLRLSADRINRQLRRRQLGYGRGARMTSVETDRVQILSGVRSGKTIGSPIALKIENRDHSIDKLPKVTRPRPGHADLVGSLKYDTQDARDILERASARETTARVAVGAVTSALLETLGVELFSHVVRLGGIDAQCAKLSFAQVRTRAEASALRCADPKAEKQMIRLIDQAKAAGDTVGGAVEVVALNVPVGLGSHVHYDRKLDARVSGALMSIQAIKAVEVGEGTQVSCVMGSKLHDEIFYSKAQGFYRKSSRSGGFEGGMTTGGPLCVTLHMKPLSTLLRPMQSVDMRSKKPFKATVERSDVTAVPSAGVVAEAVVSFELARAALEKFGGDSLTEIKRNLKGYLAQVKRF